MSRFRGPSLLTALWLLLDMSEVPVNNSAIASDLMPQQKVIEIAKDKVRALTKVTPDEVYYLNCECKKDICAVYIVANTVPGIFVVEVNSKSGSVIDVGKLD